MFDNGADNGGTHVNWDFILQFSVLDYITEIIDIFLVTLVIYKLMTLIRGTRAVQLLKGILVIISAWLLSSYFGLETLSWLMSQVMIYGVLAMIIIFQPELRRALEQLGRGQLFSRSKQDEDEIIENMTKETVKAVEYMAQRRIGALIVFQRETGLNDFIETGISIEGKLSSALLINIFIPNTPMHDGAVIIQKNQVMASGCYLPLSENPSLSKDLGTRHRAALGITESTDSISLVVSEETGQIAFMHNGEVKHDLDEEKLTQLLQKELQNVPSTPSTLWIRGKKNG